MVIGVNLVLAGLRLVYWGKGGIEKRRAVREKANAAANRRE